VAADLLSLPRDTPVTPGAFVRSVTRFHDQVEPGAGAGRYHLYVSTACPWAHRTLIVRHLKGLDAAIGVSLIDPIRDDEGAGWRFFEPEPLNGFTYLVEAYEATEPDYEGRVSVPVLWDVEDRRIVNNESAEIVVQLDSCFDGAASDVDLYPSELRDEIDAVNEVVYANVNDGVYRCGFARTQEAYDEAFGRLFDALDALEDRLSQQRYLVGGRLTLADVRLFPTLVRFDAVYHGHFKCNRQRLVEFPALWAYTRDLYQRPGFGDTVDLDAIKRHYYMTHPHINPTRIVPRGPRLDFGQPHGRESLS
jgi:putative glutathione S-transferase